MPDDTQANATPPQDRSKPWLIVAVVFLIAFSTALVRVHYFPSAPSKAEVSSKKGDEKAPPAAEEGSKLEYETAAVSEKSLPLIYFRGQATTKVADQRVTLITAPFPGSIRSVTHGRGSQVNAKETIAMFFAEEILSKQTRLHATRLLAKQAAISLEQCVKEKQAVTAVVAILSDRSPVAGVLPPSEKLEVALKIKTLAEFRNSILNGELDRLRMAKEFYIANQLAKNGVISKLTVDSLQSELSKSEQRLLAALETATKEVNTNELTAQSNYGKLRKQLDELEITLKYFAASLDNVDGIGEFRSAGAGVVVESRFSPGTRFKSDDVLSRITNTEVLDFELKVPESIIPDRMTFDPHQISAKMMRPRLQTAAVRFVSTEKDPGTRMLHVLGSLENRPDTSGGRILANAQVEIEIESLGTQKMLTIPEIALLERKDPKATVLSAATNNRIVKHEVTFRRVSAKDSVEVIIVEAVPPLAAGNSVVTSGAEELLHSITPQGK